MQLSDFDYHLPDDLIAQKPLAQRSDSRLLKVSPGSGEITDGQFTDLSSLLQAGDLLVFNDTRVVPARLFGRKQTGGKIEVLVERILDNQTLLAHVRASKSPKPGSELILEDQITCVMSEREGDLFKLTQKTDASWLDLLNQYGHMPLPPYIERADDEQDLERYQTVYAQNPGAVAAPTAGLHFDQALIDKLETGGVNTARITLHVGAGTFQPVKVDNIADHIMHAERVQVASQVCDAIHQTRANGKRVVAVGTTVVRSLEAAAATGELKPFDGDVSLFITPGYAFKVVDAIVTNFHLPKSTLLMLVGAFAGTGLIQRAYQQAVEQRYRFFSYGDAMFIDSRLIDTGVIDSKPIEQN
ncbi:MAG: S-adenosylmethionine:tRNA ribosyltransferase-isomerase [Gammaproteobacteria bacterium]|jgi:S-adenosylmethionine:tRNA ribosyltransferase-isomerase